MRFKDDGFTLIETLIAAMIATTIAYASFSIFPFLRKKEAGTRALAACNAYLSSNFSRIERMGTSPRIMDEPSDGAYLSKIGTAVPSQTQPYSDVPANWMSPGAGSAMVGFVNSNSVTDIRTTGLYTSSALLMNALYKNTATICASYVEFHQADLNAATLLSPPSSEMTKDFAVQLRVQPYDLTTRTVVGCAVPPIAGTTIIAPKGNRIVKTDAEDASSAHGLVANFPSVNNYGFMVHLKAKYTNVNSETKDCEQSRLIAYTSDITPPPSPVISNFSFDPTFSVTSAGPSTATVKFSYGDATGSYEKGVTLMCRDRSTLAAVVPPAHVPAKAPGSYVGALPNHNQAWVPCERVSMCGVTPDGGAAVWAGLNKQTNFSYTSTWSGSHKIFYGCRVVIDAVAVDASGNVSSLTTANLPAGAGVVLESP